MELQDIVAALEPARAARICDVVTLPDATPEQVMGVFQTDAYRDRVAVLHFAGHAGPEGLLFETGAGDTAVADAGGLAAFLGCQRGLQLVVLNACATQAHVDALRDAGVGAVIATSRTVEDRVAHQFAVLLYQGLGSGAGIKRAYDEATAGVRFKHGAVARGTTADSMHASAVAVSQPTTPTPPPATPNGSEGGPSTRDIKRKQPAGGLTTDDGRWPWELYFRAGAEETVAPWALPEAAGNPLFGLPRVEEGGAPLTEPFRHLRPFTRAHAELFFGRGKDIRELYDKVTSAASEPVVLLYGATGVGKSSLLDAGLLPRLTSTHEVRYAPRDRSLGLLGTLARELGVDAVGAGEVAAVADAWRVLEARCGRPLFVVIDQVEEAYTGEDAGRVPPGAGTRELDAFAAAIARLFANPADRPRGRLVLGFRKEWLSEVKAALESHRVARTEHRLDQLTRAGVLEAISGPTRLPARRMPTRLELEPGLDVLIADDLLAKRASHVAPLLQILLATMWTEAPRRGDIVRFDAALYESVQAKAKQLDKFLDEQLDALRAWHPDAVDSGLVLDFLRFYTTPKGTSDEHTVEEEATRYPHAGEPSPGLRAMCARLFLLVERIDESGVPVPARPARLAHDTIAPIVRDRFDRSDLPGPRAKRVLDGRSAEWKDGKTGVPLDAQDLAVVEAGQSGMRVWNDEEKSLIAASRVARDKARRRRAWVIRGAIAAVVLIAAFGVGSWVLFRQSEARLAESQSRELGVRSLGMPAERRDVALLYAASAYERAPTFEARRALFAHLAGNPQLSRVLWFGAAEVRFGADGRTLTVNGTDSLWATNVTVVDIERGTVTRAMRIALDSVNSGWVRLTMGGGTYSGRLEGRGGRHVSVGVWSVDDGRRLGVVPVDTTGGGSVDWLVGPTSTSGTPVAVAGPVVTLWNAESGRLLHRLGARPGQTPRAFSADGSVLITSSDAGQVIAWDVAGGKQLFVGRIQPDRVPNVAIAHDNSVFVTTADDTLTIWPLRSEQPPVRVAQSDPGLVAFAPNDSLLAFTGRDGVINIMRPPFTDVSLTLQADDDIQDVLEFSPTGARLLTAGTSGLVHVWDFGRPGFVERSTIPADDRARLVALSDDGRRVVTESRDSFTVWRTDSAMVVARVPIMRTPGDTISRRRITRFSTTTGSMAVDPTATSRAGSGPPIVRRMEGVTLAASGKMLIAWPGTPDDRSRHMVYDLSASAMPKVVALPVDPATPPIDPSGARVAYGLVGTHAVVVARFPALDQVDTLDAGGDGIPPDSTLAPKVSFSSDGSLLFAQSRPDVTVVWDLSTRQVRDSLRGSTEYAGRMLASANGEVIAAVNTGEVVLWNRGVSTPRRLRVGAGMYAPASLSPDGELLAIWTRSGLALADVVRAEVLGLVPLFGSDIAGITFTDGGARLLVVHEDGTLERIDTDPARWVERACTIAVSEQAWSRWAEDAAPGSELARRCIAPVPVHPR